MTRRVIVAGMLAGDPHQGGASWAALQVVLGLRLLGHDVLAVDPLPPGPVPSPVARYFDHLCRWAGLQGRAVLLPAGGVPCGLTRSRVERFVRGVDVVVNLSGRWRDHELLGHVPVRVYVDLDPGFTQLWHDQGVDVGLAGHTHHVTVGTALGRAGSPVPDVGVRWRTMLPPVVLDRWPVQPAPSEHRFTTVANWRSYGSIEHGGRRFGQKAHSFRRLARLGRRSPVPLEVALSIAPGDDADRQALHDAGWTLVDPVAAAGDPGRYRTFVQRSSAELAVAKEGYVAGATGWVSDRSACYLASGRPVVAQDTGIAGLPLGEGLLVFDDVDGAADGIARVVRDYRRHAAAARRLAEEHLDARKVLGELMSAVTA